MNRSRKAGHKLPEVFLDRLPYLIFAFLDRDQIEAIILP
ncbi:Uncharacterised protein [Vibrio cholerae]|nr:Uncharacterised protein [Vibrio cholerae]